jgi:putative transposase
MDRRAGKEDKEQPLFIRNDIFEVAKRDIELTEYWAKIPVASIHGGVWVPVQPHIEIQDDWNIGDFKIVRKNYGFELHLTVKKEVETREDYEGALGVDFGLKNLATATDVPLSDTASSQTMCLGSEVEKYPENTST